MQVRISKWGNSLAVRLPKELAEKLALKEGQSVDISIDKDDLKVRPITPEKQFRLEDLIAEMDALGPEAVPPYEDWGILPSEWPPYDEEPAVRAKSKRARRR